jgi:hypothetical protein
MVRPEARLLRFGDDFRHVAGRLTDLKRVGIERNDRDRAGAPALELFG